MKDQETEKLEKIASEHNTHTDFDGVLADYTGRIIAPRVKGLKTLESGCSTGVMTPMLLEYAASLDIVEGSALYAEVTSTKYPGKIKMHVSLFENYRPIDLFDCVVFAGVLHHIEKPVEMLKHILTWVKPGGKIHISVPNMTAFHRRLGVAMDISKDVYQTSERNLFFAQPGRFDKQTLIQTVEQSGLVTNECFGFFFKPFPHSIMNTLHLEAAMLDGLFQMGLEFPDLACQLYLEAQRPQ